jgi:formylglycine-generating enzyme required for sulfatase activity
MASLINTAGFKMLDSYSSISTIDSTYYLSRYYMASTETTVGQYCCFLNAIDATASSISVYISADDLSAILVANAPLSGHTGETVEYVLSIGTAVATSVITVSPSAWNLCSFSANASNLYGELYYSSVSKIFAPCDATTVASGESKHHNDYGLGFVSWYGGTAYSLWMGGMLPTVGQWYYGGCATDNSGGKAATSHYPSPVVETDNPSTSNTSDALLTPIAWYNNNSDSHVHQVAKKAPNSVGLYDVSGNLWEWCLDWYTSDTYIGGQDGVCVVSSASYRFLRGGDWLDNPRFCSLGYRHSGYTNGVSFGIGFRLAVVP